MKCLHAITIKDRVVRCGKCLGCKAKIKHMWEKRTERDVRK